MSAADAVDGAKEPCPPSPPSPTRSATRLCRHPYNCLHQGGFVPAPKAATLALSTPASVAAQRAPTSLKERESYQRLGRSASASCRQRAMVRLTPFSTHARLFGFPGAITQSSTRQTSCSTELSGQATARAARYMPKQVASGLPEDARLRADRVRAADDVEHQWPCSHHVQLNQRVCAHIAMSDLGNDDKRRAAPCVHAASSRGATARRGAQRASPSCPLRSTTS